MTSTPPLPFDLARQSDYKGWFDMINSIVGFVTASTHLASTLRNSRSCFSEDVEITEVIGNITRSKNVEYYTLLDFPWFLNELNKEPQNSVKTRQYRISEVIPLVQYPQFDVTHGEPNHEPRIFTLVDTKDFGDVDSTISFKSVPTLNKQHSNSFSSITCVKRSKTIMKYKESSDSCIFQEYTDSEQTIDSTNLQENFEKMEEQKANTKLPSSNKLEDRAAEDVQSSAENHRKVVEKFEEIEQYSTIYEGSELISKPFEITCASENSTNANTSSDSSKEPKFSEKEPKDSKNGSSHSKIKLNQFNNDSKHSNKEIHNLENNSLQLNKIDLYMECTVEDTQIVQRKKRDDEANNITSDENKATATYLNNIQFIKKVAKDLEEASKAESKCVESTQAEITIENSDEAEVPIQFLLLTERSTSIINLNGEEKHSETDKSELVETCAHDTQVPSKQESRDREKVSKTMEEKVLTTLAELRRELSACQNKYISHINKIEHEELGRSLSEPPVSRKKTNEPKRNTKDAIAARSKIKSGSLQNKKELRTPKDPINTACNKEVEKQGGTDFITKNIVDCINRSKRVNKTSPDSKKTIPKTKQNSSGIPVKKKLAYQSSISCNPGNIAEEGYNKVISTASQTKNITIKEPKTRKTNDRKSASADAVKSNELKRQTPQQKIQNNIKKPVARTVSNKEKPSSEQVLQNSIPKIISKIPERIQEIKSCLKSGNSKWAANKNCMFQEKVEIGPKRPVTPAGSRQKKGDRILPKVPIIHDTTLKLTAAENVKKASELLKNIPEVLGPAMEVKKHVVIEEVRPHTSGSSRKR